MKFVRKLMIIIQRNDFLAQELREYYTIVL